MNTGLSGFIVRRRRTREFEADRVFVTKAGVEAAMARIREQLKAAGKLDADQPAGRAPNRPLMETDR